MAVIPPRRNRTYPRQMNGVAAPNRERPLENQGVPRHRHLRGQDRCMHLRGHSPRGGGGGGNVIVGGPWNLGHNLKCTYFYHVDYIGYFPTFGAHRPLEDAGDQVRHLPGDHRMSRITSATGQQARHRRDGFGSLHPRQPVTPPCPASIPYGNLIGREGARPGTVNGHDPVPAENSARRIQS